MKEIKDYVHTVQYYETDKMGVTHHSNYIRWMEEARVDFLAQIGWDYAKLEAMGLGAPVVSVTCDYKRPTTFADVITVRAVIREIKGVSLRYSYEMKNQEGTVVCVGTSTHAFVDSEGRLVRLKRDYPELAEALYDCLEEEQK